MRVMLNTTRKEKNGRRKGLNEVRKKRNKWQLERMNRIWGVEETVMERPNSYYGFLHQIWPGFCPDPLSHFHTAFRPWHATLSSH